MSLIKRVTSYIIRICLNCENLDSESWQVESGNYIRRPTSVTYWKKQLIPRQLFSLHLNTRHKNSPIFFLSLFLVIHTSWSFLSILSTKHESVRKKKKKERNVKSKQYKRYIYIYELGHTNVSPRGKLPNIREPSNLCTLVPNVNRVETRKRSQRCACLV